jgi:hypothetical protein
MLAGMPKWLMTVLSVRYGIGAAASERAATADPSYGEPGTSYEPMALERLERVLGARRDVSAR